MQIRTDDRVLVVAMTGAGKTTMVKTRLLPAYPRLVFWDPSGMNGDWPHFVVVRNSPQLAQALVQGHTQILYQPLPLSGREDFNKVCQIVYNAGNIDLYVDECMSISDKSRIEDWHREILTSGRKRGVGIINGSQRPMFISSFIITEAEHYFIGRLQAKADIEKISYLLPDGYEEVIKTLPYYHFIYRNNRTGETVMIKP
ncbi:MAG: hypothetical protein WA144_15475 [Candidatus Methanoperedens sp.]